MAAPLRNRVLLKRLLEKGLILSADESCIPLRVIPHKCQNARQYTCLHRLSRLQTPCLRRSHYKKLYNIAVIRHASTIDQNDIPPGYIPDVPDVPAMEAMDQLPRLAELNALGEPTLQSIGLGSYYPAGLVQQGLEALHVGLDIPWWSSIMIGVVIVRVCMFPLIIKQRKTLVRYHNIQPQITKIQAELSEAQAAVDYMEAQKAADKMKKLMTDNNVNLRSIFMPIGVQLPVFMSVFFGLRKMAEFPVLSMQNGGCLWFPDLTLADPIVMLPVITAATLWLNLELGAESMKTNSAAITPLTRAIMRVMPLITLIATMQFPAALCVYWATSNIFTLIQAMFLRIPSVRLALGIPVEKVHASTPEPPRRTRIVKRFKDAYKTTSKLTEAQSRKTVEGMAFKRASDDLLQEGWRDNNDVAKPTRSISETDSDTADKTEVRERQKL